MSSLSRGFNLASLLVALGAIACSGASTPTPSRSEEGAPLTSGSSSPAHGTPAPAGSAGAVGALMPELPSTAPTAWLNGAPVRVSAPPGELLLVESWHRL